MDHLDHVRLLRGGIQGSGGIWADLGSGDGAFTLAVAECVGEEGEIYSVDKDGWALKRQERTMRARFPRVKVRFIEADFTRRIRLPLLDGVVMANSLHFLGDKKTTLALVRSYLKPSGGLIVVEYDTDRGNTWVPYPFSYRTWEELAFQNGFSSTKLLTTQPSRFLGQMFSAVSRP